MGLPEIPEIPSVGSLTDGVCSGFEDKLSGMLGRLDEMKEVMSSPMSQLEDMMGGLEDSAASPAGDIETGADSVADAASGAIPDIPDTSEIEDIMASCFAMEDDLLGGLSSITNMIGGFIDSVMEILGDAISGVLDLLGDLLEAPAAFLMEQINKLLEMFDLGSLLSGLDGYLNCLDSVCGTDISNDIDYVNNMLEDLNLDDKGNFDLDMMVAKLKTQGKDIPDDIVINVKSLGSSIKEESSKSVEQLKAVAASMTDSMEKIVDANVDKEPDEEVVTVAEATTKQVNKLKSFFS